jgi:hypothetical protein
MVEEIIQMNEELSFIPDGFTDKERDEMLRFAYYFIDKRSEYVSITSFDRRIKKSLDSAKVSAIVKKEIMNQSDWFKDVVYKYFMTINNVEYEFWFSCMMRFKALGDEIRFVQEDEILKKVGLFEKLKESILEVERRLFPNDQMNQLIFAQSFKNPTVGWAEKFALTKNNTQ